MPVLTATLAAGHVAGALTGGAAMLGHWRPLFLGFAKGGKMVATCGGALLGLAPLVGLVAAVVWIAVFALTRYASVASIVGERCRCRSLRCCWESPGRCSSSSRPPRSAC